ncbi:toxin-antitoxin system YwqK family antitoxin [uncultured Draconibacterium sp.]|uniref:toxin-antitoxin system YwqK family antitoxin n=1 Tax=uncultured Draconibacterium sp. TaxID=1573823 RepID=UPI003217E727
MKKLLVLLGFFALITTATKAQKIEEIDGIFYKNSEKFTGTYLDFYSENVIKSEVKIKKGEKHGKTTIYFENGHVNEIRSYKHNLMHGKWVMYNEHGIKISIARYKNGKKHGKWTIWNDYGNLLYELEYDNGNKTGVWKKYDEQGNLTSEREY